MTSMPASRNARAITLAPRSCPSRPGLATSTRMGAGIVTLVQIIERRLSISSLSCKVPDMTQMPDQKFASPAIHLNRIYTRAGDGGQTRLVGGQRIAKD